MTPIDPIPKGAIVTTTSSARTFDTANTPLPRVALLGAAPFTTLVSNSGGGITRYDGIAINRWRIDATRDDYGQWCYLRNLRSGAIWSATHQPVCAETQWYRVSFDADAVRFDRRDGDFETRTEIVVIPGAAVEARRVTVTNQSTEDAQIEVTSYQEVVLASILSDRGHRAFGNLFVQTEWLPESHSILAMRRPRAAIHKPVWCGHTIAIDDKAGPVTCETDRAIFIGRGRSARNPVAIDNSGDLSGTVGAVLDPVLALRTTLTIPSGHSAAVIFATFYADTHDEAVEHAREFSKLDSANKLFAGESLESDKKKLAPADETLFQNLAGLLLYGATAESGTVGGPVQYDRRDLLALGLTGEWPVVLAVIGAPEGAKQIAQLVLLHSYWRAKGIESELVFVCDDPLQCGVLKKALEDLVLESAPEEKMEKAGGVFVLDTGSLSTRQMTALKGTARIQIDCDRQTLPEIGDV